MKDNFDALVLTCPNNVNIMDSFCKAHQVINKSEYKKILCSISGGYDSDVMLDICTKVDYDRKIDYVWFNTGLEYQATKDHLVELEKKYNIQIKRKRPKKSIPLSCKQNGLPFISKHVSEQIERLQRHRFSWEDEPLDVLMKKYPNCQSSLEWWCGEKGKNSGYNISQNRYLKEFMVANHPPIDISAKCCQYAKKDVSHELLKEGNYDLNILGLRKAEGGVRAGQYKGCYTQRDNGVDLYLPLWWWVNGDKEEYAEHYNIVPSQCYTKYGMKRTGCVGCSFGNDLEDKISVTEKYEPKLANAMHNIFDDVYEYTRAYYQFYRKKKRSTIAHSGRSF